MGLRPARVRVTMKRECAMRRLVCLLAVLLFAFPAQAGPGACGWKNVIKRVFGRSAGKQPAAAEIQRAVETQAYAAQEINRASASYWKASHALVASPNLRLPYQSMAVISSTAISPATEEDFRFNIKNDRLARVWRMVTQRDLTLMQQRKQEMLEFLQVSRPGREMNYAALIPSDAKYIQIGEEHGFVPLRRAFEKIVWQYHKMYPDRKIIVLTEFVFDRTLPISEKTGLPVSVLGLRYRRVSPDFRFLEKFIKRGIEVIGLEDERYFKDHQGLITPSFRQVESVYGMKQRNDHWRQIMDQVRQREPNAVFFIYAGNMHVHYRAPFSLARASSQVFVLQLLARDLGKDLPFGAVMQNEPFARVADTEESPVLLQWKPGSSYPVLSGFDACLIFPVP